MRIRTTKNSNLTSDRVCFCDIRLVHVPHSTKVAADREDSEKYNNSKKRAARTPNEQPTRDCRECHDVNL